MEEQAFEELKESILKAKRYLKGEDVPARVFYVNGSNVKNIRENAGLSQRELAELMRVSVRTLQNWEQGHRKPTGPAAALIRIFEQAPEQAIKALSA